MSANPATYFEPRRLGHSNLWVSELKRSERFYNEVCGLAIEFWEPSLVATFLGTGNTPHDLGMIEKTDGEPRYGRDGLLQLPPGIGKEVGLNHLAWELENEVSLVSSYEKLRAAGIDVDMTVDHQVAHSVYMFDPDGNHVEFYCDTVKDWRNLLNGEMDIITGAWTPGAEEPFSDSRYDINPEIRVVNKAPIHPQRLTHAVLRSAQPETLVDFYTTVGGLEVVRQSADGTVIYLRGRHGGYAHNLVIVAGAESRYHHSAFQLKEEAEIDHAEMALRERGIVPAKSLDTPWKRSLFLLDPDNLQTEYYVERTPERPLPSDSTEIAYLV